MLNSSFLEKKRKRKGKPELKSATSGFLPGHVIPAHLTIRHLNSMDVSMCIIRVAYITCITGNHNGKALEKDVRTFQSVQDLTRAHEILQVSLGVGSLCASYVSPLFYVDWVCSLFKK